MLQVSCCRACPVRPSLAQASSGPWGGPSPASLAPGTLQLQPDSLDGGMFAPAGISHTVVVSRRTPSSPFPSTIQNLGGSGSSEVGAHGWAEWSLGRGTSGARGINRLSYSPHSSVTSPLTEIQQAGPHTAM